MENPNISPMFNEAIITSTYLYFTSFLKKKFSETFMTYNLLVCVCCVSSDKVYIYSYTFQFCKTEVSDEKAWREKEEKVLEDQYSKQ